MGDIKNKRHIVDILFVLALFLLFAVSSILLIAVGASVYRRNVNGMEENYRARTTHAVLAEKVRSADAAGCVETGMLEEYESLLLHQDINGISYTTYLYLKDGYLTELFGRSDLALPASAGSQILECRRMDFSFLDDRSLKVELTEADGYEHTVILSLRSSTARLSTE